jgi:SOUL heme-binding protein
MEMKIFVIIAIIIIIILGIFQTYITMATRRSETQTYKVIRTEDLFEIRYYPAAIMAKISSTTKSYRDLGYSGFGKLAKYIFGGNINKNK